MCMYMCTYIKHLRNALHFRVFILRVMLFHVPSVFVFFAGSTALLDHSVGGGAVRLFLSCCTKILFGGIRFQHSSASFSNPTCSLILG